MALFFCFNFCDAQEIPKAKSYFSPAYGYTSYINTVEKPAWSYDMSGNYAIYRYKLNYLIGGQIGFDIGRHTAVFVNFAAIYYKKRYWTRYGGWSREWNEIENKSGGLYYSSLFIRYKLKDRNKSSLYCFAGPAVSTEDNYLSYDLKFGYGILAGIGYSLKICSFISINIEGNYLGLVNRPSSINFQIRPEFGI